MVVIRFIKMKCNDNDNVLARRLCDNDKVLGRKLNDNDKVLEWKLSDTDQSVLERKLSVNDKKSP